MTMTTVKMTITMITMTPFFETNGMQYHVHACLLLMDKRNFYSICTFNAAKFCQC